MRELYCPARSPFNFLHVAARSVNFEPDRYRIPFLQAFNLSNAGLDRYQVAAVLGEEGGGVFGAADAHMDGNNSPALRHQAGDRFQVAGWLLGNGHKEPGSGTAPEPDLALELDVHG